MYRNNGNLAEPEAIAIEWSGSGSTRAVDYLVKLKGSFYYSCFSRCHSCTSEIQGENTYRQRAIQECQQYKLGSFTLFGKRVEVPLVLIPTEEDMLDLTAVNVDVLNSVQLQNYIIQVKALQEYREAEGLTDLEPQTSNTLQSRLDDAEARLGKLVNDNLAAAEARAKQKIDSLKTTAEKRSEAEADLAKIAKLKKKLRG